MQFTNTPIVESANMSDRARRRANTAAAAAVIASVTAPVVQEQVTVTPESGDKPKSIRQLIMSGILAGKPTKEIAAAVQAEFPTSAAAAKSTKHIAWYRSRMKKDGQIPAKAETAAPTVDAVTAS
jgi:ribosomal protein L11 methylase PrmA